MPGCRHASSPKPAVGRPKPPFSIRNSRLLFSLMPLVRSDPSRFAVPKSLFYLKRIRSTRHTQHLKDWR